MGLFCRIAFFRPPTPVPRETVLDVSRETFLRKRTPVPTRDVSRETFLRKFPESDFRAHFKIQYRRLLPPPPTPPPPQPRPGRRGHIALVVRADHVQRAV